MSKAIAVHKVNKVRVIFKRTLMDILRGAPRTAEYTGFDFIWYNNSDGLVLRWGNKQYSYPAHSLHRVALEITEEGKQCASK